MAKKKAKKPAKKKAKKKKKVAKKKKAKKKPPAKKKPAKKKPQQKNPEGRPTKYKKEYCKALIDYFDIEPTKEVEVVTTFKNGKKIKTEKEERANHIPFFADFAAKIGVTRKTLLAWREKHPEFLSAYARAQEMQKQHLITCGLLGLYNGHFAIFTAKNITDMKDQQEHVIEDRTEEKKIGVEDIKSRLGALEGAGTGIPTNTG